MFPVLNAFRAYELKHVRRAFGVLARINPTARSGLVFHVRSKLGVYLLRRSQFTLSEGNLRLQKIARELRISYLRHKLIEGGFDFRISAVLRSAEKSLQLGTQVGDLPDAVSKSIGPLYRGVKSLWVQVQGVISGQVALGKLAEQMGIRASEDEAGK